MTLAAQTPSTYLYDLVIFICRAQPPHKAHIDTVDQALTLGKKVKILLGSCDIARDTRNPFTYEERARMFLETFEHDSSLVNSDEDIDERLSCAPMRDYPYNDNIWAANVQQIVNEATNNNPNLKVALIGHKKADTEYYLNMFPQWDFVESAYKYDLCATDVRNIMFNQDMRDPKVASKLAELVPIQVGFDILNFAFGFDRSDVRDGNLTLNDDYTNEMQRLRREASFLRKHAKSWATAPYPPIFSTVDSIVIQSGHVLLIQRKSAPGEGLFAVPGGYLEQDERIIDGMLRELTEETRLKVPMDVVRGSIAFQEVFDYPKRSLRGRIVTHAYCIVLKNGPLPKIKARSDAKKAEWVTISEFYKMQDQMFEDHYHIVDHFLAKLKDRK